MNTIAVYPGSFDPITNGHLDIIERAAKVFDTLIVAVLANPRKAPLLDVETRIRVIREALAWLAGPEGAAAGPFDIVIVDPPYAEPGMLVAALEALGPLLAPQGRVVAKHFWRDPPPASVGLLASERERRFGETTLTFYRRAEDR